MTRTTPPKIGAHVSIAGGIANAPTRAAELGCETFQCFTRSPQGGPAPELTKEVLAMFRANMDRSGIGTFYIHAPYYINLASTESRIRHSSINVLRQELERGGALGASYVMAHPGSYTGQTYGKALGRVREAIPAILEGYSGTCGFLLEISAGSGNVLGDTFQEVGDMMASAKELPGFGGVCFDTCHAFASGYDYSTPEKAASILEVFDRYIGLSWLKLTHVNDSKVPLSGKRDRHEHLGKGHIGLAGLAALLETEPFRRIDWLLETGESERPDDIAALRGIREKTR